MRVETRNLDPSWPLVDVAMRGATPRKAFLPRGEERDEGEEHSEGGAELMRG